MKTQKHQTLRSQAFTLTTFLSQTIINLGDYSKVALMGENYPFLAFYENRAPNFLNLGWFFLYLSLTVN